MYKIYLICRQPNSAEESVDFFDRFSKIRERANTVRQRRGDGDDQVRVIQGLNQQRELSSPQFNDGSNKCGDRVEASQPAPGWIWGPELITGPEVYDMPTSDNL